MQETNITRTTPTNDNPPSILRDIQDINELAAPLPYQKYLPEITPVIHQMFLQATGEVKYHATYNYMFQALFQEEPERSLGYLCRSFDNLNKGDDYIDTKRAIHIGFLDYILFSDFPEFHAIYKMQNIKNHNNYTNNFILHVIELNSIHLATKEDCDYGIDKWASFFKAKTWEDIRMLANQNPSLLSAAETLYQLNMNDQLRETCERFIKAEARENGYKNKIANQAATIAELTAEIARLQAEIIQLTEPNTTDKK